MSRGLLLGAGFSYDLGMPLAKGLTEDLFHFLNKNRIRKYLKLWRKAEPYGEDRPIDSNAFSEIIELLDRFKNDKNSNYENLLKIMQERSQSSENDQSYRDAYHYIYGKFFSIISYLFYMYHTNYFQYYETNKKVFNKFSDFVGDDELWVLTLNHDLMIEFLCMNQKIPISYGTNKEVEFPINNNQFENTIKFNCLNREDMNLKKMNFIKGKKGVNIIKLHGALNEFTYNDEKKIIHIKVSDDDTPISYLNKLGKILHEMKYIYNGHKIEIGGTEFAISDMNGEMQFLRQSILMGGYKYSKTFNPKPGEEKLQLFKKSLEKINELTIVGYSFCDEHINLRLYNAMLMNPDMKIMIVDPFRNEIPKILKPFNYKMRVRMTRSFTPEWLWYSIENNWNIDYSKELDLMRGKRHKVDKKFRESNLGRR